MDRLMTIAEIESEYVDEWVLVTDPLTDPMLQVHRGTVVWHSRDRDEVYRKAIELHPARFAVLFTGELPEDTAIVL